jgi:hypothetical protein
MDLRVSGLAFVTGNFVVSKRPCAALRMTIATSPAGS